MAPRKKPPVKPDEAMRQAFLAAVAAAPLDDTPRLVFADWLDDHDDADRAEFIRLGCREAQMDEDNPQRPALEERLKALRQAHALEWQEEIPPWARKGVAFRRGFIDSIVTSATLWIKRADHLLTTVPLTGVRLEKVPGKLLELLACPSLAGMRYLSFGWEPLEDAGVAAIAAAPTLANLQSLDLNIARVSDAGLEALAGSPHLTGLMSLNLRKNQIGPAGAEALAASPSLLRLTHLELSENRLTDRGVVALASSPVLGSVRSLSLYARHLGDEGASALAASPHTAQLRWLALSGNAIGNAGATALAGSPHLPNLKRLYLHQGGIEDAGAVALATSPHLVALEELTLDSNQVGPEATAALRQRFGHWARLSVEAARR